MYIYKLQSLDIRTLILLIFLSLFNNVTDKLYQINYSYILLYLFLPKMLIFTDSVI